MKQLGGIIRLWDPAISEAETIFYHFEILLSEDDLLVLDRITPWDRNAFRTWLGNIMWVIPGKQEGTCLSIHSNELVIVRFDFGIQVLSPFMRENCFWYVYFGQLESFSMYTSQA
jgi:hypothetical protein